MVRPSSRRSTGGGEGSKGLAWKVQSRRSSSPSSLPCTRTGGLRRSPLPMRRRALRSRLLEVSIGATFISRPRASSLFASRSWSPWQRSLQCPMKGQQDAKFLEDPQLCLWMLGQARLRTQGSPSWISRPAARGGPPKSQPGRDGATGLRSDRLQCNGGRRFRRLSSRGHVEDMSRDAARNDRTFARSTAKLTPALFAEVTGGSSASARGRRTATQTATVVVSEVETPEAEGSAAVASTRADDQADENDLQPPTGEPVVFKPHRTP